jgi:hypothetical protein
MQRSEVNTFITFCMENYKHVEHLTGSEVFDIFKKYKVIDYLKTGYDVLHTVGKEYLIEDIREYIKSR